MAPTIRSQSGAHIDLVDLYLLFDLKKLFCNNINNNVYYYQ